MMLEDIEAIENQIHELLHKKDRLVEVLRQKNLIELTMEMANNGNELH